MSPKQHVGESGKKSRIGKDVEDLKMAMAQCLSAWVDEQPCSDNKVALEALMRTFRPDEPMLPVSDHYQQALASEIMLIVENHPWFRDLMVVDKTNILFSWTSPFTSPNAISITNPL